MGFDPGKAHDVLAQTGEDLFEWSHFELNPRARLRSGACLQIEELRVGLRASKLVRRNQPHEARITRIELAQLDPGMFPQWIEPGTVIAVRVRNVSVRALAASFVFAGRVRRGAALQ